MKKHALNITKAFLMLQLFFITSSDFVFPEAAVRVEKVFDGDTVLLTDGRKVRYLGINTPEWQEPFYLKAKQFNESLVLGKEVRLEFDDEQNDTYGRLLAYVYVGDQMVNARLIEEGFAHAFFFQPNQKHKKLLLKLQEDARNRKAGIWSKRGRVSVLKITSVHPARHTGGATREPYVRIANIGNAKLNLKGYTLSAETRPSFSFPARTLEPGYTVLVVSGKGTDGVKSRGQLTVYWEKHPALWDKKADTVYLAAPDATLIDTYHYRVSSGSRKPGTKK